MTILSVAMNSLCERYPDYASKDILAKAKMSSSASRWQWVDQSMPRMGT
jgi:hypothetical protein